MISLKLPYCILYNCKNVQMWYTDKKSQFLDWIVKMFAISLLVKMSGWKCLLVVSWSLNLCGQFSHVWIQKHKSTLCEIWPDFVKNTLYIFYEDRNVFCSLSQAVHICVVVSCWIQSFSFVNTVICSSAATYLWGD